MSSLGLWSTTRGSRSQPHLYGIERSPNTVRAYAFGLRFWFEFLELRDLAWDRVGVEDVSRFVAWLRSPADKVILLDSAASIRAEATVNRHLAAVFGFYDFHARSGVDVAAAWSPGGGCRGDRSNRSFITSPPGGRSRPGR